MARICFPKALIERRENMDFSDDGTRFRGYSYRGVVPITYTKVDGMVFCDIRFDYCGIPYEDCEELSGIANEFNGVTDSRFDMDKFINNCAKCYEFISNYNTASATTKRLCKKIDTINEKIKEFEMKIKELENTRNQYYAEIDNMLK